MLNNYINVIIIGIEEWIEKKYSLIFIKRLFILKWWFIYFNRGGCLRKWLFLLSG